MRRRINRLRADVQALTELIRDVRKLVVAVTALLLASGGLSALIVRLL